MGNSSICFAGSDLESWEVWEGLEAMRKDWKLGARISGYESWSPERRDWRLGVLGGAGIGGWESWGQRIGPERRDWRLGVLGGLGGMIGGWEQGLEARSPWGFGNALEPLRGVGCCDFKGIHSQYFDFGLD